MVLGLMKSFENGNPQVIMGDFNSGPAAPGIAEKMPETFEKFLSDGFVSANTL